MHNGHPLENGNEPGVSFTNGTSSFSSNPPRYGSARPKSENTGPSRSQTSNSFKPPTPTQNRSIPGIPKFPLPAQADEWRQQNQQNAIMGSQLISGSRYSVLNKALPTITQTLQLPSASELIGKAKAVASSVTLLDGPSTSSVSPGPLIWTMPSGTSLPMSTPLTQAHKEFSDKIKQPMTDELLASLNDEELDKLMQEIQVEIDDDISDLTTEDILIRDQVTRELKNMDEDFARINKEMKELTDARNKYADELALKEKAIKMFKYPMDEIPQTVMLPVDLLISMIEQENRQRLDVFEAEQRAFVKTFEPQMPLENGYVNGYHEVPSVEVSDEEEYPSYYQPDEVVDFETERERCLPLIRSLGKHLVEYNREMEEIERAKMEKYAALSQQWVNRQCRTERNTKKISKDNKNRELYEKTFPDIRRAREEKERNARSEKRPTAKSEPKKADEIFMNYLRNLRPTAQDHPMGRIIEDPLQAANDNLSLFLNSWSVAERACFQRKFFHYGKNFPAIAACIGTKTTNDCIRYFYLTKQHVKYKQLHKMKRKKAGKQYKPNMVPTEGEIMIERIKMFPFMKTNRYVECLICERRMHVFLVPKVVNGKVLSGEYVETITGELPICDACNTHIRKAKAANFSKCPLQGCSLGRRRTKPNRTIPETANTLPWDRRRFIINRRKLHPEAIKCCGSCIRKIQNDFADLANGKFEQQIMAFERGRFMKKYKKELEGVPTWSADEIRALRKAIEIFGVSNWYEVACRVNVPDKTPYFCYMKYKDLCKTRAWRSLEKKHAAPSTYYDPNDQAEQSAIDAIRAVCQDLLEGSDASEIRLKSLAEIKEEPEPEKKGKKAVENGVVDEYKPLTYTARERQMMRHYYLEALADLQEDMSPEYVSENSVATDDGTDAEDTEDADDTEELLPNGHVHTEEKDVKPDFQLLNNSLNEVHVNGNLTEPPRPPTQRIPGLLSQGTAGIPDPNAPLRSMFNANSEAKSLEEELRMFGDRQVNELLNNRPKANTTLPSTFGILPSLSALGINPPTTSNPPFPFALPSFRNSPKPPSPMLGNTNALPKNLTGIFSPGSSLGTRVDSPNLAQLPLLNLLNQISANLNSSISAQSVITQQQPFGLGNAFKGELNDRRSKPTAAFATSIPTVSEPSSVNENATPAIKKEFCDDAANTSQKVYRKSGVVTACLPHVSHPRPMNLRAVPSPALAVPEAEAPRVPSAAVSLPPPQLETEPSAEMSKAKSLEPSSPVEAAKQESSPEAEDKETELAPVPEVSTVVAEEVIITPPSDSPKLEKTVEDIPVPTEELNVPAEEVCKDTTIVESVPEAVEIAEEAAKIVSPPVDLSITNAHAADIPAVTLKVEELPTEAAAEQILRKEEPVVTEPKVEVMEPVNIITSFGPTVTEPEQVATMTSPDILENGVIDANGELRDVQNFIAVGESAASPPCNQKIPTFLGAHTAFGESSSLLALPSSSLTDMKRRLPDALSAMHGGNTYSSSSSGSSVSLADFGPGIFNNVARRHSSSFDSSKDSVTSTEPPAKRLKQEVVFSEDDTSDAAGVEVDHINLSVEWMGDPIRPSSSDAFGMHEAGKPLLEHLRKTANKVSKAWKPVFVVTNPPQDERKVSIRSATPKSTPSPSSPRSSSSERSSSSMNGVDDEWEKEVAVIVKGKSPTGSDYQSSEASVGSVSVMFLNGLAAIKDDDDDAAAVAQKDPDVSLGSPVYSMCSGLTHPSSEDVEPEVPHFNSVSVMDMESSSDASGSTKGAQSVTTESSSDSATLSDEDMVESEPEDEIEQTAPWLSSVFCSQSNDSLDVITYSARSSSESSEYYSSDNMVVSKLKQDVNDC